MMLEDENANIKADYEAKKEEVRTFRMGVKDKFEKERELDELRKEYEAFKSRQIQYEHEYKQAEEKAIQIRDLESANESLNAQLEVV